MDLGPWESSLERNWLLICAEKSRGVPGREEAGHQLLAAGQIWKCSGQKFGSTLIRIGKESWLQFLMGESPEKPIRVHQRVSSLVLSIVSLH